MAQAPRADAALPPVTLSAKASAEVVGKSYRRILRGMDLFEQRRSLVAERPLFGVTLVDGARRETLPVEQLYGGAIDDPALKDELPYCDCEVLLDRTYFLPLGDPRWSDETLVAFDYMEPGDAPRARGCGTRVSGAGCSPPRGSACPPPGDWRLLRDG